MYDRVKKGTKRAPGQERVNGVISRAPYDEAGVRIRDPSSSVKRTNSTRCHGHRGLCCLFVADRRSMVKTKNGSDYANGSDYKQTDRIISKRIGL